MKNRERYPPEWYDTIRPSILKRDKYTCQKCGLKHRKTYVFIANEKPFIIPKNEVQEWQNDYSKVYTVFLQVAHLDHNEKNNDPLNLLSLCPGCHLNYDRKNNSIRRKAKFKGHE